MTLSLEGYPTKAKGTPYPHKQDLPHWTPTEYFNVLLNKILTLLFLVFCNENKWNLRTQILFSWKTGWSLSCCDVLYWRIIIYYYLCYYYYYHYYYYYYWDSLHASLNSNYEALSYIKKKHKIIITYRKSV